MSETVDVNEAMRHLLVEAARNRVGIPDLRLRIHTAVAAMPRLGMWGYESWASRDDGSFVRERESLLTEDIEPEVLFVLEYLKVRKPRKIPQGRFSTRASELERQARRWHRDHGRDLLRDVSPAAVLVAASILGFPTHIPSLLRSREPLAIGVSNRSGPYRKERLHRGGMVLASYIDSNPRLAAACEAWQAVREDVERHFTTVAPLFASIEFDPYGYERARKTVRSLVIPVMEAFYQTAEGRTYLSIWGARGFRKHARETADTVFSEWWKAVQGAGALEQLSWTLP